MDSQLHVGYLTILYFMISGFFAESQELREDARGQFKSLPGKFWHKCLRIYPVAIVACGRRCSWSLWSYWPPVVSVCGKPLAKYMKKYEWQNLRPVDPL